MVLKPGTGESFGKKVWKKIKLHGTQTLHACTLQREKFWRRVKLQGSQIFCEEGNGVHAIGKGIELQGAQTTPPSEANKAMFWKRKNCRVLKLHPFRLTYGDRFRRR
jgi:hypothetical protein